MKLDDKMKKKIQDYFDSKTDEELYDLLVNKYNAILMDTDNDSFSEIDRISDRVHKASISNGDNIIIIPSKKNNDL